jgi:hypothetical protein
MVLICFAAPVRRQPHRKKLHQTSSMKKQMSSVIWGPDLFSGFGSKEHDVEA